MRNNCYFISQAETSSTVEGISGWGEDGRATNRLFVLSYKAAFSERGREGGREGDTGVKRFDDAADAALLSSVRSLCLQSLSTVGLAQLLPGELNV